MSTLDDLEVDEDDPEDDEPDEDDPPPVADPEEDPPVDDDPEDDVCEDADAVMQGEDDENEPDEYRIDPHDNDIPYDWGQRDF